jgi:hypothetical protein
VCCSGLCFLGIVVCVTAGLIFGLTWWLFTAVIVLAIAGYANLFLDLYP